jgi:hypothetical protein
MGVVSVIHKYFTEFWPIRAIEKEEDHKNQKYVYMSRSYPQFLFSMHCG